MSAAAPPAVHAAPPGRPDLPRRKISPHTIGKIYTAPDGKIFRPSMFITLTCPSYGRVTKDGTPAGPSSYDYQRAARDALHFAALFDRFIQNQTGHLTGHRYRSTGSASPLVEIAGLPLDRCLIQNRAHGCLGGDPQDLADVAGAG